ncbi:AAA family ATPase, partial [Candidatus Dojkabacteria bacterium]|nr:AAA family ATPase [Candidatus Dojkabacteria bacterium]
FNLTKINLADNSTPIQTNTSTHNLVKADQTSNDLNSGIDEIAELEGKVATANLPKPLEDHAYKMIRRIKRMTQYGSYSGEYEVTEKYIDWIVSIPWGKETKDNLDLAHVKSILDSNHFGIEAIKDRMLEYLAVMNIQEANDVKAQNEHKDYTEMARLQGSSAHAPIICFVGLQGIGKTSMAKSIAEALGRKFARISLGALGSVYEIRGRSRAFLDAEPGQIVKAMVRTGVSNPLILLDEIDKVSGQEGLRADVMASLLEILDPEQNSTFVDHYIDYPIDLSKIMFITTANNLGGLSTALLDRLEIVRFTSYTDEEKQRIAIDYLLPKVLEATGLTTDQLKFDEQVWPLVIRPFGYDAGVRQLERNLTNLARKVAREIVEKKVTSVVINKDNVKKYLPEDMGVLS